MAGSVTENVTKLSFTSERMQAAERSHNFVVDFSLRMTSTVVEVSRCRSSLRCLPSSLTCQTLRRRDVVQSPFTVVEVDLSVGDVAMTIVAVESPTDLFVASH